MVDSFLVIFPNILEQLIQGTPSDGCFLKNFCSMETVCPKVLQKLLWKIWEKFWRKRPLGYIIFNLGEQNHSITDDFLRILWNVLEQLF